LARFVAKAQMDNRFVDLPFSDAFYKLLLGFDLSINDIKLVDPQLGKSVMDLQALYLQIRKIESNNLLTKEEQQQAISELKLNGVSLPDLDFVFTLPGYDNIELKEGGKNIDLTTQNLPEYLYLVTKILLVDGVKKQIEHFRAGFNEVFGVFDMKAFSFGELDAMICGSYEQWTLSYLKQNTKCDHGYSHSSRVVQFLLDLMVSLNINEQKQLLRFITGSPKLPVGGLANLEPKLTIVLKTTEGPQSADYYLPSVMTCANYLKLPDYSSPEVLREKLFLAMQEGQESFHLS